MGLWCSLDITGASGTGLPVKKAPDPGSKSEADRPLAKVPAGPLYCCSSKAVLFR